MSQDQVQMKRMSTGKIKLRSSLMWRYLLLICVACLFIPFIFPVASVFYLIADYSILGHSDGLKYGQSSAIQARWYKEAAALGNSKASDIDRRLEELSREYPEAAMFWVDAQGDTRLQLPQRQPELALHWSPADAIRFMKNNVNGDPFTVVAFIGENNSGPGFMVMQLPRELLRGREALNAAPIFITFISIMFLVFLLISLLFFIRLRRRLLRLQKAMTMESDIPMPIVMTRPDEIGQLEAAFNRMVTQLEASKEREREEESLRKKLISNLSHDLRTPLTVLNGHLYTLRKEQLGEAGQDAIRQMEGKIDGLSRLIDNLLSYTLMESGRYPLKLESLDVIRLVRESAAAWYPLWEREGIEADVDLPDEPLIWRLDKEGFRRILDNWFQNVVRHASQGGFLKLSTERMEDGRLAIVLIDHGPGLGAGSEHRGAGIGLAIVNYLTGEMGLGWEAESLTGKGTKILLYVLNEI
ncbi:histidine kinase dimerization/phospho-acceptor domain-containing protein [Paenibacillus sp. NPDC058174]|uniref:HAMP domain-containing sensor histidine kinase n=1 Tax=Paenibacillus sp. NPDC058174 TaxID=3346366 RepID=UPI0036DF4E68